MSNEQKYCCEDFKLAFEEGGFTKILNVKPEILKEFGKWKVDVLREDGETRTLHLKKCPFCGNDTIQ